jgi:hypothetical protein
MNQGIDGIILITIFAEGNPETQGRPTCLIMNQGVDVVIKKIHFRRREARNPG